MPLISSFESSLDCKKCYVLTLQGNVVMYIMVFQLTGSNAPGATELDLHRHYA